MSRIIFNNQKVEDFTFILSNRNYNYYGQLNYIEDVVYKANMTSADELSFTIYKNEDKASETYEHDLKMWKLVKDFALVFVKELDTFFELKVDISESNDVKKTITATELCYVELSNVILRNIEINTELDISRPDYTIPTVFYREIKNYEPNSDEYKKYKNASLLHRILDKTPNYTIGHVDTSLWNLQRSFSIDGQSVCDFFIGDCATQFNCLFVFDSKTRTINVYDLYNVCNECGERTEFDVCPNCQSTNLKKYGEDTTILIDREKLSSNEITLTTNTDNVKNCLYLKAGDDDMTAAVRNINPSGSNYIYYFNDDDKADMSESLRNRLEEYDELYNSKIDEYQELTAQYYNAVDEIAFLESVMMPGVKKECEECGTQTDPLILVCKNCGKQYDIEHEDNICDDCGGILEESLVTICPTCGSTKLKYYNDTVIIDTSGASDEVKELNSINLSPLGLSSVTNSTSLATVNSSIKNYAKAFIHSSKYKVEVNEGKIIKGSYIGSDGFNHLTWEGNFVVTSYSNDKDTAKSETITVDVTSDYEEFLRQKLTKKIVDDEKPDIFNVLSIDEIEDFKVALRQYCLNRLTSFKDAIETAMEVLRNEGQAESAADFYETFYLKYLDKLNACIDEINVRNKQKDYYENNAANATKDKQNISDALNLAKFLGSGSENNLYVEFMSYMREGEYANENYISDGLSNEELLNKANEFLAEAKKELFKSAERQHSISGDLNNLLLDKNFSPIVDKFEIGNWLRVKIEDDIYRLRLISFTINFSDIQTIQVEFSDLTKTVDGYTDIKSILDSASSMSKSFSYVAKQANEGSSANTTIGALQQEGLNSALYRIKNSDLEEIILDNHGLLCRSFDDELDDYSDEQCQIIHNSLVFTRDNWKTASTALGKINYTLDNIKYTEYGLVSDIMISGKVIAGQIYSANYANNGSSGTHFDLDTGSFSLADNRIVYDSSKNVVTLKDVVLDWNTSNPPDVTIDDVNGLSATLEDMTEHFEQLDGRIETYSQDTDPSTDWTTTTDKQKHTGDLWYDPTTRITQRWNGTTWEKTTDSDLTILAQTKAKIFTTTPQPPYSVGDLWVSGSNGDIKHCIKSKTTGSYSASDWAISSKYTDDTTANEAKTKAQEAINSITSLETGLGYSTQIGDKYVISPYIGGGYLDISSDNNGRVIIDPNNIQKTGKILGIYNKDDKLVVGVDTDGNGTFSGKITTSDITATGGTIGGWKIGEKPAGLRLNKCIYIESTDDNGLTYYTGLQSSGTSSYNLAFFVKTLAENDKDGEETDVMFIRNNGEIYTTKKISVSKGNNLTELYPGGGIKLFMGSYNIVNYAKSSDTYSLTDGGHIFVGEGGSFLKISKDWGVSSSGIGHNVEDSMIFNYGLNPDGKTETILINKSVAINGGGYSPLRFYPGTNKDCYVGMWSQENTLDGKPALVIDHLFVPGNFHVNGNKYRAVQTENYGTRCLSAYETTVPYFGDIGSGIIDETGECYVYIDEVFAETCLEDTKYYIFLQSYSENNVYIKEKHKKYFVVGGQPETEFDFEIKMKQRGVDGFRLEEGGIINGES